MQKLIAFTGKAGAGKTTLAKMLEKDGYTRISFATPLKTFLKTVFMWEDYHFTQERKTQQFLTPYVSAMDIMAASRDAGVAENLLLNILLFRQVMEQFAVDRYSGPTETELVQYMLTPREAMQYVGTDMFHQLSPMIWVDKLVELVTNKPSKYVLDDVRFDTEVKAVRDLGGVLLEVVGEAVNAADAHRSENGITATNIQKLHNTAGNRVTKAQLLDTLAML